MLGVDKIHPVFVMLNIRYGMISYFFPVASLKKCPVQCNPINRKIHRLMIFSSSWQLRMKHLWENSLSSISFSWETGFASYKPWSGSDFSSYESWLGSDFSSYEPWSASGFSSYPLEGKF